MIYHGHKDGLDRHVGKRIRNFVGVVPLECLLFSNYLLVLPPLFCILLTLLPENKLPFDSEISQ